MNDIIVGTAGHIDHGKTTLVRALTGIDADRLPEEKHRGITIDIGFAELDLDGTHFAFVDVPGHEKFVKNMLAGASGIDVVLLVIAADEGVMPQTREHFEICRLLGLSRGIIVLTRSDLADEETLELAKLEAAELAQGSFLESAAMVPVSSVTGAGLDELRSRMIELAGDIKPRADERAAFLPIDRSFSVKGFGSVVTGTLAGGRIAAVGELELLPAGRRLRVRGVQTHGRTVPAAVAGQRTAVNLAGIDHTELERGMVLAAPGVLRPTQIIDAETEILAEASRPLRSRQRVRVHIGTSELLARIAVLNEAGEIAPGEKGFVQIRLESPAVCVTGDRFILRSYSPQRTIGGGRVIVPQAAKHRKRDTSKVIAALYEILVADNRPAGMLIAFTRKSGVGGTRLSDLNAALGLTPKAFDEAVKAAVGSGEVVLVGGSLITIAQLDTLRNGILAALNAFHRREPLADGMPKESLRERVFQRYSDDTFAAVIALMTTDGSITARHDTIKLTEHRAELSDAEVKIAETLRSIYRDAGFAPPTVAEALERCGPQPAAARTVHDLLVRSQEIVKVTDDLYFAGAAIDELKSAVRHYADGSSDRLIDVPRFKAIAGVSRKYAIPLLEYFDREKVTVRAADKRIVLK